MVARDVITKDFGWKFLSLGLAIAIWVTVSTVSRQGTASTGARTVQRIFYSLPVVPVSASGDVREFKTEPVAVEVTVAGRQDTIAALTEKEIRATVDLTSFSPTAELQRRVEVSTPPGVTFIGAKPSQVNVHIPIKSD